MGTFFFFFLGQLDGGTLVMIMGVFEQDPHEKSSPDFDLFIIDKAV